MRRLALFSLLFASAYARADLSYTLTPEPTSGSIAISVKLTSTEPSVRFRIPAWCPGFYQIRSYHEKIYDVRATSESGKALDVTQPDFRSWQVNNPGEPITLTYRVKGDDAGLGFFAVNVRKDSAFINGPAAFMFADGRLNEKCHLAIKNPSGWSIATAMDTADAPDVALDYVGYVAKDYDEFIDHPIQLGAFRTKSWKTGGIPFQAVYVSTNGTYPDLDASAAELQALSEPAMRMFRTAGFKRYLYIVHLAVGNFGGGLEHRASNVMAVSFQKRLVLSDLAAHEYFHAWNVKQIRPSVLGPFDYTQKVRTGNLWFAEGVTDYYAQLHTYEANVYSENELLDVLGGNIGELQRSRTRMTKTLEAVCRETWESSGFGYGDLSYYTKGLVAGLIFDAAIRNATDGERTLDDVMRLLWDRHRLPKPGYDEDGIRRAINEVAMKDLSSIYDQVVRSTREMPYELLQTIGLRVVAPGQEYSDWTLMRDPDPSERAGGLLVGFLKRT